MGLVLSFRIFRSVYPELFPPCNITVMSKQSGTPKVHVSPVLSVVWFVRVFYGVFLNEND